MMFSSLKKKPPPPKIDPFANIIDEFAVKNISKSEEGGTLINMLQRAHNREKTNKGNLKRVQITTAASNNSSRNQSVCKEKPVQPQVYGQKKKVIKKKIVEKKYIPGVSFEFEIPVDYFEDASSEGGDDDN